VGLFSKKAKIEVCDMCGRTADEGCGSVHKHVAQIVGDEPAWLPPWYRTRGQGEFTWLCTRCNSFPAMKWPKDSGAWAGMMLHLGNAHYVGEFKGVGGPRSEMIEVR
jgi:hypothetical protein